MQAFAPVGMARLAPTRGAFSGMPVVRTYPLRMKCRWLDIVVTFSYSLRLALHGEFFLRCLRCIYLCRRL